MPKALVGLGSNLGDRLANIARAAALLAGTAGVRGLRVSSIFETEPVVGRGSRQKRQRDYLNGAAAFETSLAPDDLLAALLDIERRLGRKRSGRWKYGWGPRVIDLDLLLYGRLRRGGRGSKLTVPHPRMLGRSFVLRPAAEIAPRMAHPGAGETMARLWRRMEGQKAAGLSGKFIAIEGPIAAGKTTIARALARRLGARLVLEEPRRNPFLARYYKDRDGFALRTQLAFLVRRRAQMEGLSRGEKGRGENRAIVSDYFMERNDIFAGLSMGPEDLALYRRVALPLSDGCRAPDVVLYLEAPEPVLARRVAGRARPYERGFSRAYLAELAAAYREFFRRYRAGSVVRVETSTVDLDEEELDVERLVEEITRLEARGGGEMHLVGIKRCRF